MELSPDALMQLLSRGKDKPVFQKNTGQVYIETTIQGKKIPIFFGILGDGYLLQMISYLPFQLKEERLGDIALLLHRLNKEIDLPGYGMDEENKLIYYRVVVYCDEKELNEKTLDIYVKSSQFASAALIEALGRLQEKER